MWFRVVKAAKYLGVSPWELVDQPVYWLNAAEDAQDIEAHADKIEQSKHRK